jgi:hypothetical protein
VATNQPYAWKPKDDSFVGAYRLIDIFEPGGLWEHRYDDAVFRQREDGKWGIVGYTKITKGKPAASSANPPWSWNDHNDPSPMGEIATDPAHFIGRYCQGLGPLGTEYIFNPYLNT